MNKNKYQIRIKKLAKKYDLKLLLLFGSQLRYKKFLHPESDVDIAYISQRELSGEEIINFNCDLIDTFNYNKIDIVDLKKAPPFLCFEISKNSKLLFGKKMDYLEFKAVAFKKYIDTHSLFELEDFLIKKRQKSLGNFIYDK